MRLTKPKLPQMLALMMLIIGVFFCAGAMTAHAAQVPSNAQPAEVLSVDEVWLTGDVLHIAVTDKTNGEKQTLELNLSDYAKPGDEYVSVQATDKAGRTSNIVQFKNPYYVPEENTTGKIETPAVNGETAGKAGESAIPDGAKPGGDARPFTPDGAGSIVDNATDGDGKEFFTVETADGNVYYLIVDRQRNAENVYFLNAVTEDDLMSLAKPSKGKTTESAIPTTEAPAVTTTPEQPTELTPTPPKEETEKSGGNSAIILIVIAALAVGGAGYYFKIVRPKKAAVDDFDDFEPDGDEEMPISEESEGDEE